MLHWKITTERKDNDIRRQGENIAQKANKSSVHRERESTAHEEDEEKGRGKRAGGGE